MNWLVLLTSVLGFTALSIQFYFSVSKRLAQGHSLVYAVNHYFSFFTILTNFSIAILLLAYFLYPNSRLTLWFKKTSNNAAIALYILIVSLIYYTLLLNTELQSFEMVATHILHGYVPVVYLLLWFYKFRRGDLRYYDSVRWVSFPFFYFIYILIRGTIVDAYPYFFINVAKLGYPMVLLYATCILLIFLIIGFSLVALDRKIKIKD